MGRSIKVARALREVAKGRKVGPSYTLQNPPASTHPQHLSAWEMEDMVDFCDSPDIQKANFDSCVYEQRTLRDGKRHLKPQKFAGCLERLESMSGRCTCETGVHVAVVGKRATAAAAMYSSELCVAYASRLVNHFEKMVEAEFLEDKIRGLTVVIEQTKKKRQGDGAEGDQARQKLQRLRAHQQRESEAEEAYLARLRERVRQGEGSAGPVAPESEEPKEGDPQQHRLPEVPGGSQGLEGTKAKSKATPGREEDNMTQLWHHAGEEGGTDPNVAWKGGFGKYGMLRRSTAFGEQSVAQVYLGGMRHPARVVRDMPNALNVGLRVRAAWERSSGRQRTTEPRSVSSTVLCWRSGRLS